MLYLLILKILIIMKNLSLVLENKRENLGI